jgi:hypothetical protein
MVLAAWQAAGAGVGAGTTVVVIRSPKILLAAVDSRETWVEYRGGIVSSEQRSICKARKIGPFYALVAGTARGTNGFNALDEVAKAYNAGLGINELAGRVRDSMPAVLGRLLDSVRESNPEEYTRRYAGQTALQIVIAGVEAGVTRSAVVEFFEDSTGSAMSARMRMCPGECSGLVSTVFLGIHGEIDALVARDNAMLLRPAAGLAESLIAVESAAHPDVVGGPVSIVKFDKSGGQMVQGGACAIEGDDR